MKKSRFWNGVMLFVLFVSMAGCASQVFSEVKESASVTKNSEIWLHIALLI
jgi:hypothetical protein